MELENRRYYSVRTGKNPNSVRYDLSMLLRLFRDLYIDYEAKYFFQEAFGYYCVDAGEVQGQLGGDIDAQIFRRLRKEKLWPIEENCLNYTEDDLFDIIEFLYDCVSKPAEGLYHSFSNCGWHYSTFDRKAGQASFRNQINIILRDYDEGYELSEMGEILSLPVEGMVSLLAAPLPTSDNDNIASRVDAAKRKFRYHRSSLDERRDAVRDLADVLEFLRPRAKRVISKADEGDLFNIANNFGIRHHNESQKTGYNRAVWYSWLFYYYLATIHACLRLIADYEAAQAGQTSEL